MKSFYFWFAWGSICLIPAAYYGVYAGFVVEGGKYYEYSYKGKFKEADIYLEKTNKLLQTIGYLTLFCNLISCILMALVLRLVKNVSSKVTHRASGVQT